MRGNASLLSTYMTIRNRTRVQIISPSPGETRKLPPESSAAVGSNPTMFEIGSTLA
jgi:hypothetical protein